MELFTVVRANAPPGFLAPRLCVPRSGWLADTSATLKQQHDRMTAKQFIPRSIRTHCMNSLRRTSEELVWWFQFAEVGSLFALNILRRDSFIQQHFSN